MHDDRANTTLSAVYLSTIPATQQMLQMNNVLTVRRTAQGAENTTPSGLQRGREAASGSDGAPRGRYRDHDMGICDGVR